MSRAQLSLPTTRRPRTPNGNNYDPESGSLPTSTRPLQINRPPTQPTTPTSSNTVLPASPRAQEFTISNGPFRPQRSGLRSRQVSEYSEEGVSIDSRSTRDSRIRESMDVSTSRLNNISTTSKVVNGRPRPSRDPSLPLSPASETDMSPTSAAAIAAFQSVISRRRANTRDGIMDEEYERAKVKEMEVQKVRQKRIRDKMPSRKTGRHKPGDIDG